MHTNSPTLLQKCVGRHSLSTCLLTERLTDSSRPIAKVISRAMRRSQEKRTSLRMSAVSAPDGGGTRLRGGRAPRPCPAPLPGAALTSQDIRPAGPPRPPPQFLVRPVDGARGGRSAPPRPPCSGGAGIGLGPQRWFFFADGPALSPPLLLAPFSLAVPAQEDT